MEVLICHLTKLLTPHLLEGFDSIYTDMNSDMEGFKRGLQGLKSLNEERRIQEAIRIETKLPMINKLLDAIGIKTRQTYGWKHTNGPKIPKLKNFIYKCYVVCAEIFMKMNSWDTKPSSNRNLIIEVIRDTIKTEAMTMLSVDELIRKVTTVDMTNSLSNSIDRHSRHSRQHSVHSRHSPKYHLSQNTDSLTHQITSLLDKTHINPSIKKDDLTVSDGGSEEIKSLPIDLILDDKKKHIEKLSIPTVSLDVQKILNSNNVIEEFGSLHNL